MGKRHTPKRNGAGSCSIPAPRMPSTRSCCLRVGFWLGLRRGPPHIYAESGRRFLTRAARDHDPQRLLFLAFALRHGHLKPRCEERPGTVGARPDTQGRGALKHSTCRSFPLINWLRDIEFRKRTSTCAPPVLHSDTSAKEEVVSFYDVRPRLSAQETFLAHRGATRPPSHGSAAATHPQTTRGAPRPESAPGGYHHLRSRFEAG
jgi:hypothetical protein